MIEEPFDSMIANVPELSMPCFPRRQLLYRAESTCDICSSRGNLKSHFIECFSHLGAARDNSAVLEMEGHDSIDYIEASAILFPSPEGKEIVLVLGDMEDVMQFNNELLPFAFGDEVNITPSYSAGLGTAHSSDS